jgi:NADH-quinone oxidoreductase subunit F
VDLHLLAAEPIAEERDAIDRFLGSEADGWTGGARNAEDAHTAAGGHAARGQRHLLLPALRALQARVGWISEGGLNYICERLTIPPADAYGVATFYALLSTTPRPPRVVHVCDDIACRTRGAARLCDELEKTVGTSGWLRSPCLGLCEQAPAAFLTEAGSKPVELLFGGATAASVAKVLSGDYAPATVPHLPLPQAGSKDLRLLRRIGVVDPSSFEDYRAHDGYKALAKAAYLGPEGVRKEVTDARLAGRGGAAFPTGRKWDAVAQQPERERYVVANADESEPGTFKDRVVMEGDPFSVIEAMTIAGYATGAGKGYIYLRGEYPLARDRLQHAINEARANGMLGESVHGLGVKFDIELRVGAGAYICGEETAIFNSIEGYRGEPRNKPPFPVEAGLFGKPTLVNNVETLINVLEILRVGGAKYAETGSGISTGPRLFCLSGSVQRPGMYEVAHGTSLRDLIALAGGVAGGRELQAVLLGGAAGGFIRPDEIDLPLTFEATRAAGSTLGSGVVMLFDDEVDLVDILRRIAAFFRDESCGQCVPCRVGTVRQEEALHRILAGKPRGGMATERALLEEIGLAMKDASICGLGQTAYGAVESAIKRLGLFEEAAAS